MNKKEIKILKIIHNIIRNTYKKSVLSSSQHFAGLYKINCKENVNPDILVSSTDGVGTKIKMAMEYQKFNVIGIDCFAMCINDILCYGANPLFFLDYFAYYKINIKIIKCIIQSMANECNKNDTCFIGGETAEMDIINKNDCDIVGFCVGMVKKNNLIEGKKLIKETDVVLGLPSSGIHSNGFSMLRKIFSNNDLEKIRFSNYSLYEVFLKPTKIYYKIINFLLKKFFIHGIANITGGGICHNLSRIIPNGLSANIKIHNIPPIFNFIQKKGNLSDEVMWKTFNMGIGMIIVIDNKDKDEILYKLKKIKEIPIVCGIIKTGNKKVMLLK